MNMLVTLTEYMALTTARVRVLGTDTIGSAPLVLAISEATEVHHDAVMAAIDGLEDAAARVNARQNLDALVRHTDQIARLDRVLEAAAILPAHLTDPDDLAAMADRRDGHRFDQARALTALVMLTMGEATP